MIPRPPYAVILALLLPLATHCKSPKLTSGAGKNVASNQPNSGASELDPAAGRPSPASLSAERNASSGMAFPVLPGPIDGTGGDTPLVVNLATPNSLQLVPTPQRFDIDGDGESERIDWLSPSAGFIALDLNDNGYIDSGRELFGSGTVDQVDFRRHKQGFSALAAYDADKNGVIDANDPIYEKLLIWQDLNSNATSDAGELRPLSDYGIVSLNLRSVREANEPLAQSRIILKSTATRADGTSFDFVDVVFKRYQDVVRVKHVD